MVVGAETRGADAVLEAARSAADLWMPGVALQENGLIQCLMGSVAGASGRSGGGASEEPKFLPLNFIRCAQQMYSCIDVPEMSVILHDTACVIKGTCLQRSPFEGLGVWLKESVKKGDIVAIYTGELKQREQARSAMPAHQGTHYVSVPSTSGLVIDGSVHGFFTLSWYLAHGVGSFINSGRPLNSSNCGLEWRVEKSREVKAYRMYEAGQSVDPRFNTVLALFRALRDIDVVPGQAAQLRWDYQVHTPLGTNTWDVCKLRA